MTKKSPASVISESSRLDSEILSQIDKKYFSRNLYFGRVIKFSVKAKVRSELWHFHEYFGYLLVVLSVRLFKVQ